MEGMKKSFISYTAASSTETQDNCRTRIKLKGIHLKEGILCLFHAIMRPILFFRTPSHLKVMMQLPSHLQD